MSDLQSDTIEHLVSGTGSRGRNGLRFVAEGVVPLTVAIVATRSVSLIVGIFVGLSLRAFK